MSVIKKNNESERSSTYRNKSKRKIDMCEQISENVNKKLQNDSSDEFDIIGQNIAHKLRKLPKDVKLITEKMINDVLFEAEIGNINMATKLSLNQAPSKPVLAAQYNPTLGTYQTPSESELTSQYNTASSTQQTTSDLRGYYANYIYGNYDTTL